jgi:thiol-disulfide isomerase/thioredoxin
LQETVKSMKRPSASDIVLKVLGILLLVAAVLKGHELLTVPVANTDLWSWRPFLIFQVECELALGIWLVSGLLKRLAWLGALGCFSLFCCVTLYKGLTGAASCGCFGTIHVSPWITLFAIDLPALASLGLFRPRTPFVPSRSFLRRRKCISGVLGDLLKPLPPLRRFAAAATLGAAILGVTTPILALNEPAVVTSSYEVLEPETWVGKELPILEHVDIADTLRMGTWLILLYHYDCPDCARAIPMYEQMARDLAGNEDLLRVALIAVPPYGRGPVSEKCPCTLGRLDATKEWFVSTPVVALLIDGRLTSVWQAKAPDPDAVLTAIVAHKRNVHNGRTSASVASVVEVVK